MLWIGEVFSLSRSLTVEYNPSLNYWSDSTFWSNSLTLLIKVSSLEREDTVYEDSTIDADKSYSFVIFKVSLLKVV